MAYSTQTWTPGTPIKQEKMEHMETGISNAHTLASNAQTTANGAVSVNDTQNTNIATLQNQYNELASTITINNTQSANGQRAWTELLGVGVEYNNTTDTVTKTLARVLQDYTKNVEIEAAYKTPNATDKIVINGSQHIISSLAQRIQHIYNEIGDTNIALETTNSNLAETDRLVNLISDTIGTTTGLSIGDRLNALDGGSISTQNDLPSRSIKDLITEIANAHVSQALATGGTNRTFTDLDTRFENIETEIVGTHMTGVQTLDARFDNIDGGSIPSRTLPNVISEIDAAHRTNLGNDSQTGEPIVDTLDRRFDDIDSRLNAIDNTQDGATLVGRISTLENTYVNKNTDIVNGLTHTLDNKSVLDARQGKVLDDKITNLNSSLTEAYQTADTALNDRISALEDTVDDTESGIAIRTSALEDAVDTLEGTVQTLSTASDDHESRLDMIDGGTELTGSPLVTRVSALETTVGDSSSGLVSQVNSLESTITDSTTGLAAIKTIADAAKAKADTALQPADLNTLNSKVTALEGKDTIVIGKALITYNSDGIPTNIGQTPTIDADYLLQQDDDKYYYWRYINNNWELISGAGGGSGNSNAEDFDDYTDFSSATKELNKDYYVYNTQDGIYHHYRYLSVEDDAQPIEIGYIISTNNIKRYNLTSSSDGDKNYIDLYEFDYGESNTDFSGNNRIAHIELVGGGGGGVISSRKFTRITPKAIDIAKGSNTPLLLQYFYTTGIANESDKYTLTQSSRSVAEHVIDEGNINSGNPEDAATTWPNNPGIGFGQIDVMQYCRNAEAEVQTFTLKAYDEDNPDNFTTISWNINIINLSINSNFTQSMIAALGQTVKFTYIPSGNVEKTAVFEINGTSIGSTTLSARTVSEQTYNITMPAAGEGVYQLKAYLTAVVGNKTITSEPIYRDLVWKDEDSDSLILGSPYRDRTVSVMQYDTISIPYTVAGSATEYEVSYYADDMSTAIDSTTLRNTNGGTWKYKPLAKGNHTLRIQVEDQYITINLVVEEMTTDIEPVDADLVLDFNPQGLNNNSNAAKNWTNGTYHLTTSSNFDWYNGGYGSDADGEYFLIKSGTRAYFDYKMFKPGVETIDASGTTINTTTSDVYRTGQELKIIFKTKAVRSIDAVWFTNTGRYDAGVDKEVGIQLSAHQGWLKTDTADITTGGNDEVALTNRYLYFPYSEEDRIELDININKEDQEAKDGNFIMSYEDGVPSKAYAYTHSQKLYHVEGQESIITIGSDDCDVYIYRMRIYDNELTPAKILRNFIADGRDIDECIARYNRNCIYYDSDHNEYSPYADDNFVLDAEALATKIPNVKVLMLDAPYFTENKNTFVKNSTLRCIHADGGTLFKSRGAADNWYFENGYHAGQGTTSDKYGDAGRNIDFLFNCDGPEGHKPSNKVDADLSYTSQVTTGYGTEQAQTSVVSSWIGDSGKVSLTETSVPNNFFNFKVNIASSENVNNALLQKRYNDFLPYVSPASVNQHAKHPSYNSKVTIKNDMEFVPAVLFIRENGDIVDHKEFKDQDWHFYALGNLGDSKKTDYTRAYDPDDLNEFTIEISDNNTNNSQFQTGVYRVNGVPTLEQFVINQDREDDGVTLIEDSYTAQGTSGAIDPYDYVFPLDTPELKAMWNATDPQTGAYLNKNHWALVNEPYDGDHSFEMRYAFCGNFRDGKLVNGNKAESKAIQARNSKVWQAFYSWVVTSSNEEFVQDLDQWCVRSAVEFWYAFTHYYTMMDSRAKNTFWHFAKTGKYRRVKEPLKDLLHTYDESSDATENDDGTYSGTFTRTSDTEVSAGKTYYTEYAFDMWDYDNDTALGINNNGELIFPYGKEDKDYTIDGDPASGFVFNGAGSVFWRRLSDLCTSEISSIFTRVNEQFFNADNLIEQFDAFQECYPEALWQVDINRKYIRPFTGKSVDNSKERNNPAFLKSMMQGRKKYQRRQWIKDQYYYFGSKYKLNNVMNDFFLLDCYTGPDDQLIADLKAQGRDEEAAQYVGSNWNITITPYQDMYLNANFGETAAAPVRAKAGNSYEFEGVFTSMSNSRIYIYGASRLQALGGKAVYDINNNIIDYDGLASLYIGRNEFNKTDKLRKLKLGTDKPTYRNSNLIELTLPSNSPILEELDIRNCGGLAGEKDLSGCTNLRVLEAEGTNYSRILLPSSSQITTLHLPSTITGLTLQSARLLNDLSIKNKATGNQDYSNIRELLIDNSDYSTINWVSLASGILDNLTSLNLLNLHNSSIGDISELEAFKTKKNSLSDATKVQLSGIIKVLGKWSQVEKDSYGGKPTSVWPDLNFDTTNGQEEIKTKVVYMESGYYTSNQTYVPPHEITTIYVSANGTDAERVIPDIYYGLPVSELPTRPSTIANNYSFGSINQNAYVMYSGWSLSQGDNAEPLSNQYNINAPYRANTFVSEIILYTYYRATAHKYAAAWYLDDDTVVKTVNNQDFGGGYNLEAPTVKDLRTGTTDYSAKLATVTFNQNNTVTYKIFDGWEKLPTDIHPSVEEAETSIYRINAKWYTETKPLMGEDGLFSDTSNPTLEQLFVLSRMDANLRNTVANSKHIVPTLKYEYTMGFEGTKAGTVIATNKTFNSNTANTGENTTITPFANNDGFTLMIDYEFDANQPSINNKAAVLLGCYAKNGGNITGFALYNNKNTNYGSAGIRVGYGDMFSTDANKSVLISTRPQRNILVLRHPKGSSQLWIYSSAADSNVTATSITIPTPINITTQVLNENAVICLGHLRANMSSDSTYSNEYLNTAGAYGTIYEAKYWNEDLGAGECKQLAAWPHERMTALIAAVHTDKTNDTLTRPSIYLTNLTASNHGFVLPTKFSQGDASTRVVEGWGNSTIRTICDQRVLPGLPIRLQAILSHPNIGYHNYESSGDEFGNVSYPLGPITSTDAFVYLPSISSLWNIYPEYNDESIIERTGNTEADTSDITPYPWIGDAGSVEVWEYDYTYTEGQHWRPGTATSMYYNLRFANKPFSWSNSNKLRIFYIPSGATLDDTVYEEINNKDSIRSNDIVVIGTDAAYIYISANDYNLYSVNIDTTNSLLNTNGNGGWLKSMPYVTRSVSYNTNNSNFVYINRRGGIIRPAESTTQPANATGPLSLTFAFTI